MEEGYINRRVYVGNLSWQTQWQSLKDHMRQAGDVVHAEVFEDASGRSAGCGVVEYETLDGARQAIATLNDSVLDGRQIFVREDREPKARAAALPRSTRGSTGAGGLGTTGGTAVSTTFGAPYGASNGSSFAERGRKIVVLNLPYSVRWQELKDVFRDCGNVVRADVLLTSDGKSRGMGTVVFETEQEAERAIESMNGAEMDGRPIHCRFDKFA
eukprot:CAMPEP_0184682586 /NCGR_PEP_ID=MMETSP0312-20130426/7857_1 /TAXON_ID=31354 /ORGANISM="Compsopogon coeruleus, Strain SAG 36.94" /LENGTH=213 /DNA_ID=CAMNT_0027134353 /DNA_START=103 /DNA_END=744 /DNA_ORIENTATION=+